MLEKNKEGMLTGIIEKPEREKVTSNLINVNRLVMSAELLRTVVNYVGEHDFKPTDQEYVITDAYAEYIKNGGEMRVVASTGKWMDCGSVEGWVHANNVITKE